MTAMFLFLIFAICVLGLLESIRVSRLERRVRNLERERDQNKFINDDGGI